MYEIFELLLKRDSTTAYRVSLATGVPNSTFSEWKKGLYTPKVDKMQKIAAYFGVTLEYLLTGKEASNERKEN